MGEYHDRSRYAEEVVPVTTDAFVDLYWLPVGAGAISRPRQWSLDTWEAFEAMRCRRPRAKLYHSALKIHLEGRTRTLELTPVFRGESPPASLTGSVGLDAAGRFRIFRYQVRCTETDRLPDEEWAVRPPLRLTEDPSCCRRVLDLIFEIPHYTWGRRAPGTSEMWTSDSAIAWLLVRVGVDARAIQLPPRGRAPGWKAGLEVAAPWP